MSVAELRALWRLHLVDARMLEISKRLTSYSPNERLRRELEKARAELHELEARHRELKQAAKDLELQDKAVEERLKRLQKDLYGGKVVNPREVEAIEHEIESLKKQRGEMDLQLLELWERLPEAEQALENPRQRLEELEAKFAEAEEKLGAERAVLEEEYSKLAAARPKFLEGVSQTLLARYEAIRQRQGGIGMAEATKEGLCGACGTTLPRTAIENAKLGQVATCQECHRIIYATEGAI
ncbi:MAG TPA: hypothetical protein DER07_03340 [Armatimonadetes bacterium]|nr:hypothetical protein [Armatimonadota bacterium]